LLYCVSRLIKAAGHAIVEFAIGSVFLVLLFLKTEPFYEGLVLTGVISTIFMSVVLLIKESDNPFDGYAVVDSGHIYKLDKYLDQK
jgi:hypothetical protein